MHRIALALLVMVPWAANAQVVSLAPEAVEVSIYRASPGSRAEIANLAMPAKGLAMISETRTIDLPAGVSTIHFRGVAETIVPQSAKLESLPGKITESNFDYRLIGPGELVANSVGKSVRFIRTDRQTGNVTEQRGTLIAGPEGVLISFDGRVEALGCSGASERIVFDEIPTNLTADPTLSATVNVTQAGKHRVRLSYLATGMDWSADYVARIHPDGRKLDLSGWITLANKQRTSFADAQVHVVAGNVSVMEGETVAQTIQPLWLTSRCWPIGSFIRNNVQERRLRRVMEYQGLPVASAPMAMAMKSEAKMDVMAKQTDLGDYKLYTVPATTTVASKQIKQVKMIDQKNVPFERLYTYHVDEYQLANENVTNTPTILLRLQNKKNAGLGVALPAGTAAVIEPYAKSLVFAGEQKLKDLPVGLPVEIEIGQAMDIRVRPRAVRHARAGDAPSKERIDIEVDVANDKPVPIVLELSHSIAVAQDFHVSVESQRHTQKDGMPMWTIKLKPGERVTLSYSVEHAG
jgi:hypothetical protein